MDVKMLNVDPENCGPNKKAFGPKLGCQNVSEGWDLPEDIRKIYLPGEVDVWRSLKMLEEYGGDLSDIEGPNLIANADSQTLTEEEYTEVDVDELTNFVYMDPDIYMLYFPDRHYEKIKAQESRTFCDVIMEEDEIQYNDTVDNTNMTNTFKGDETSTVLRDGREKAERTLKNIIENTDENKVGKPIGKDDSENDFKEETTKYQTCTEAKIKDESIKGQVQNDETIRKTKEEPLGAGDRKREEFDDRQIQQTFQTKTFDLKNYNKAKYAQDDAEIGDCIGKCNRAPVHMINQDRIISTGKEYEIKKIVDTDQNIQKLTDGAASKWNNGDDDGDENMGVYIRLMASPKIIDGFRSKAELTKDIYSLCSKGVLDGGRNAKVEYFDEVLEVSSSSSIESNLEENSVNKDEEKKRTTTKWRRFLRLFGIK